MFYRSNIANYPEILPSYLDHCYKRKGCLTLKTQKKKYNKIAEFANSIDPDEVHVGDQQYLPFSL